MNIYFYSNNSVSNNQTSELVSYLKKLGVSIFSNILGHTDHSRGERIDGVILYGDLDTNASYLLANYLAQGLNVLYLFQENSKVDSTVASFASNPAFKGKLSIVVLDKAEIKQAVNDFFKDLDSSSINDKANIKFTLRLSRRISDYLDWKTAKSKKNKADFIRDEIASQMNSDEKYRDFLDSKYKH